jgi:hypothetical protein
LADGAARLSRALAQTIGQWLKLTAEKAGTADFSPAEAGS